MLSRTADSLFWMSRYVERAEFLARTLEATIRLSTLPASYAGPSDAWAGAVAAAGVEDAFYSAHGEANEHSVAHFLAFSPDNPSSIRSCIERARANARAVRTALTIETWEAINAAWLELRRVERPAGDRDSLANFITFAKTVSLSVDGSAYRTMLRNDAWYFTRIGVYVERADNTARLLDVKYHLLLPENEPVGGSLDYYQWAAILRAVSALTAYRWVYRQSLKPRLVADLLTLNREMPCSLASCYEGLVRNLDAIAAQYGQQGGSQRLARAGLARLENTNIDAVMREGLHEFITAFLKENARLGQAINDQYLS